MVRMSLGAHGGAGDTLLPHELGSGVSQMAYVAALGIVVFIGLIALCWVARAALTPAETYTKRTRSAAGQITYCKHCDTIVTRSNWHEHGVNCGKRPGA